MTCDWLQLSIPALTALCRRWLDKLTSEEVRDDFRWNADLCGEAAGKIKVFLNAHDACVENDSAYNRTKRRETRAAAVAAMRAFAASSIRNNPFMSESAREGMGLRRRNTTHTPHPRPEALPRTEAEPTGHRRHRVRAVNPETGKTGKPAGVHGIRFVWRVGGERPASGSEIAHGKFSRKPEIPVIYEQTDVGKPAYYACCYENAKGEAGPWSTVVEVYIG